MKLRSNKVQTEMDLKYILLRGGIILTLVSILCLLPALLLWFLGYKEKGDWNKTAVETNCLITDHKTPERSCSYSCNCHSTCHKSTDGQSCSTTCSTCYRQCWDEVMVLQYEYHYIVYTKDWVVDTEYSEFEASEQLKEDYPIGSEITCYLNPNNPNDLRLELNNIAIFLGFFIVFVILGGLICSGWIVYESFIKPRFTFDD